VAHLVHDSTFADLTQVIRCCGCSATSAESSGAASNSTASSPPRRGEGSLARASGGEQARAVFSQPRFAVSGDNLALVITDELTGRSAVYAPGLAAIDGRLWEAMQGAACVMVDGTFWTDDEMIRLGISRKRAQDIGSFCRRAALEHVGVAGAAAGGHPKDADTHQQYQPILDEDSAESAELRERSVENRQGRNGDRIVTQDTRTQAAPWSAEEFEAQLLAEGKSYHIHHPTT